MKILNIFLILLFMLSSKLNGQMITNTKVWSTNIEIGDFTLVQFQVNMLKSCDSFEVVTDIDYQSKTINIEVNYNHVPECEETNNTNMEFLTTEEVLITGEFEVKVNTNILQDSTLNESIIISSITVANSSSSCNKGKDPSKMCPAIYEPVCGCDGMQYDNICIAYFHNGKSAGSTSTCENALQEKIVGGLCTPHTSINESSFFHYPCLEADETFGALLDCPGDEVIIEYTRDLNTTNLEYSSNHNIVALIADVDFEGNIRCLPLSTSAQYIDVTQLQINKPYLLVIDSEEEGPLNINVCDSLVATKESSNITKPYLFSKYGNILSLTAKQDLSFVMYDISGKKLKGNNLILGELVNLSYKSGVYILNVQSDGKLYSEKVIL